LEENNLQVAAGRVVNVIHNPALRRQLPSLRRKYLRAERAVDKLRAEHPELLRRLEARFRKAHPRAKANAANLMEFASQHDC
jgi:hypothetical protein